MMKKSVVIVFALLLIGFNFTPARAQNVTIQLKNKKKAKKTILSVISKSSSVQISNGGIQIKYKQVPLVKVTPKGVEVQTPDKKTKVNVTGGKVKIHRKKDGHHSKKTDDDDNDDDHKKTDDDDDDDHGHKKTDDDDDDDGHKKTNDDDDDDGHKKTDDDDDDDDHKKTDDDDDDDDHKKTDDDDDDDDDDSGADSLKKGMDALNKGLKKADDDMKKAFKKADRELKKAMNEMERELDDALKNVGSFSNKKTLTIGSHTLVPGSYKMGLKVKCGRVKALSIWTGKGKNKKMVQIKLRQVEIKKGGKDRLSISIQNKNNRMYLKIRYGNATYVSLGMK